ncbi:MAG TPA: hypothetical protein VEH56_03885 [Candidatus Saccharimonadales bacterium]|nr:hypothetical protein [Candidatus Saccharimonadales bacterium]
MPHPSGIIAIFLLVRLILGAAIVVSVIWLLFKLGRLTEAYTEKLKKQTKQAKQSE